MWIDRDISSKRLSLSKSKKVILLTGLKHTSTKVSAKKKT